MTCRSCVSSAPNSVVGVHQTLRAFSRRKISARVLPAPSCANGSSSRHTGKEAARARVVSGRSRAHRSRADRSAESARTGQYVWRFPRERFISGVRPDIVDLIRIDSPPGWFAEEGWHLTPETLNMSERLGRTEGVAYIRNRPDAALLVLGGESVAAKGASGTRLADDRRSTDRRVGGSGRRTFLQTDHARAGSAGGRRTFQPARRLVQRCRRPPRERAAHAVGVASPNVFFVQHAGWNEIEYSKDLQRRWRWTTGRAQTFVNSGGRDLTLTLAGESPLRYFDAPPRRHRSRRNPGACDGRAFR